MRVTMLMIEDKEAGMKDYFTGLIRTGPRFTLFYACLILFFGICLVDALFYVRTPSLLSALLNSWVLIGALSGCLLMLYLPTLLLVHKGRGILKLAAALILSNLVFSLKALLLAAVVKLMCLLAALPLVLCAFTFLALFLHFTYMEAAGRYAGARPGYAKERSVVKEFLIPPTSR
jgi:hypothetical protein